MCTLHIFMQCYDRFYEISLNEKEKAEFFVEEVISHALLSLFGEAIVEDVSIQLLSGSSQRCSLSVHAQCSCEEFIWRPRSQQYMSRAIEQSISSIFRELSIEVEFDNIQLRPSHWQCRSIATLSYKG